MDCVDCRKFGEKLFLKGERCMGPKCAITRRVNATGAHPVQGGGKRRKKSEYGLQLAEKQKAKAEYGLRERQFVLVHKAAARKEGVTGEIMLQLLEARLDNVVYRLGWAPSRKAGRQLVNHGHIKVNGKMVNIPSYKVGPKDTIEANDEEIVKKTANDKATVPSWIKVTPKSMKAEIVKIPERADIDTPIDEQLIVEFYSR